jgi:hypothetical protein
MRKMPAVPLARLIVFPVAVAGPIDLRPAAVAPVALDADAP